jgi:hypothetical protein
VCWAGFVFYLTGFVRGFGAFLFVVGGMVLFYLNSKSKPKKVLVK